MLLLESHLARLTLAGYRPRTIHTRRMVVTAFEKSLAGPLTEATRLDVERFLARDLAAETRRSYLQNLRAFYAWLVKEDILTVNPTAKIESIRVKRGTPRPIDTVQLVRAIELAPARMKAWLLLMSLAGLRCLEVAHLRPADLLQHDTGVLLFLRETKGGGTATVPAHPDVLAALARLPISDGAWWTCTPHRVTVATGQYLRSLGIRDGAHSLRHHAATSFYKASGHDLLTTASLLRHQSVQSTMGYAALDPTRPAEVVSLVPHLRAV